MTRPVLRTDGGSRGNPGPAGAGFVIEVAGRVVCEGGCFLGVATNNVAEYEALAWGLDNLVKLGHHEVSVRCDSELVVKQVRGEYRVKKADLKPLHGRVLELLAGLADYDIKHVRREHNEMADALANQAMDVQATVGDPVSPPAAEGRDGRLF